MSSTSCAGSTNGLGESCPGVDRWTTTRPTSCAPRDGRLVATDLLYADGPSLYATAATDPDPIAAKIPEAERRFMTEIPLAASGPWQPGEREAIRAGLTAAGARKATP